MDNNLDEQEFFAWSQTASTLAKSWHKSMLIKAHAGARFEQEDIRDFLVDLYLNRGVEDEIFEEKNRGRLYKYSLMFLQHSRDGLRHAESIHAEDDDGIDEDRLQFLSVADADPLEQLERLELNDEIGVYAERISAVKSDKFSNVLSEIFQVTTRSGRNYTSSSRQEKVHDVIMQAARARGISSADLKKLAVEIVCKDRRRAAMGHEVDLAALESFEAMFSLKPKAKATTTKTTSAKTPPAQQKPQGDFFAIPLSA
ncbi:hypothetical protein MASR1M60_22450 [Rhodocyclaceae bacterium]